MQVEPLGPTVCRTLLGNSESEHRVTHAAVLDKVCLSVRVSISSLSCFSCTSAAEWEGLWGSRNPY